MPLELKKKQQLKNNKIDKEKWILGARLIFMFCVHLEKNGNNKCLAFFWQSSPTIAKYPESIIWFITKKVLLQIAHLPVHQSCQWKKKEWNELGKKKE